jgi:hypothetical protein
VSLAWPVQRHCGGLAGQVETAAFPNRACRRTESRLAIAPAVLAARRRKVCRAATKHCPPHRRKELCETSHNCNYVQRSIMCSGGVVIGVFPAQRDSGGCAAEHNRQLREDHRARRDAKWTSAGWASPCDRPAGLRRWFPGIPEPAARIAISGRPAPDRPGGRDIDRSTCRRLFREPSIMRSSECTERALSRRNAVR